MRTAWPSTRRACSSSGTCGRATRRPPRKVLAGGRDPVPAPADSGPGADLDRRRDQGVARVRRRRRGRVAPGPIPGGHSAAAGRPASRDAADAGRDMSNFTICNRPAVRFADKVAEDDSQQLVPATRSRPRRRSSGRRATSSSNWPQFKSELGINDLIIDLHRATPAGPANAIELFATEVRPQLDGCKRPASPRPGSGRAGRGGSECGRWPRQRPERAGTSRTSPWATSTSIHSAGRSPKRTTHGLPCSR